jgi:TnpA family transposase
MPRRSLLTPAERENLLAIPSSHEELIRLYTLSKSDLSLIRQHRGAANRLGFAVQLCYMRYPGVVLELGKEPPTPMLGVVAQQLKLELDLWAEYGKRDETRREHLSEMERVLGFRTFGHPTTAPPSTGSWSWPSKPTKVLCWPRR